MILGKLTAATVVTLSLGFTSAAIAGPAWEFSQPATSFNNDSWAFGNNFLVNSNVMVTALGFFYDPASGLGVPSEVALYTSTGVLLATATVDNSDVLLGNFMFQGITPVALTAGNTYQVVGVSHSNNYTWNNPGFVVDSNITYLGNTWQVDSNPTFMNFVQNDVTDGYFGPNLYFEKRSGANDVPEPGSLVLLLGGIAGLIASRRRANR